jgi:hypothetical protein
VHALYQRLRELDWDTFQRLAFQLIAEKHPGLKIQHVDGSGGDRGIDLFAGQLNEHPTIWQCKRFSNGLRPRQRQQVTESLRTALAYFRPRQWILVICTDLDTAGNQWFQKLQHSYRDKCSLGIFQGSDIVRELIHRRNIRDTFFPGAVLDTVTVRRALATLPEQDLSNLDTDIKVRMDELIARLEDEDARFTYQILYGANTGPEVVEGRTRHPLLVASIIGDDKRVNVFARDLESLKIDPPKVTFSVSESGMEKLQEHLRTGRPQQLDHGEIIEPRSTFDFLLPQKSMAGWSLVMRPPAHLAAQRRAVRLTFSQGDQMIRYDYVQFRIVRRGTEELEIESLSQLPFVLSLVLSASKEKTPEWGWRFRFSGTSVRAAGQAISAFSLLRSCGSLELYSLDVNHPIATLHFGETRVPPPSKFESALAAAAVVCERYGVDLSVPEMISGRDIDAINLLLAIDDGLPMGPRTLNAKVVKTIEHEQNIRNRLGQHLVLVARAEQFEPKPVLFGMPINTGPVTLHASDARLVDHKAFLRNYNKARCGAGVPIRFRARDVRVERGRIDDCTLLFGPDPR